jgi:uncharacterized protein (DUF1501 family)
VANRTRWTVEIEDHKAPDDWYAAAIWEHQNDGSNQIVARVPQSERGWDTVVQARDEANARLLAAAPDLLDALESVLSEIGAEWDDSWSALVYDAAVVAVAKARGEGGSHVAPE